VRCKRGAPPGVLGWEIVLKKSNKNSKKTNNRKNRKSEKTKKSRKYFFSNGKEMFGK
jgi:hypothetical protein